MRNPAFAIGFGLLVGVMTQIGQSILPGELSHVANSISVWVTVAFFVGATARTARLAAVYGFATLVAALVGYYAMVFIRFGYTGGSGSLILWTIGALVGGFVFGAAGWYWRRGGRAMPRIAAISLLSAVYIAEGLYFLLILPSNLAGLGFVAAGSLVPLIAGSTWRERGYAWLGLVPALALGAVGYVAVTLLSGVLAGV